MYNLESQPGRTVQNCTFKLFDEILEKVHTKLKFLYTHIYYVYIYLIHI